MKKNRLINLYLWTIFAILSAGCWSCSLDDLACDPLPSLPVGKKASGLEEAKAWYETHKQGENISVSFAGKKMLFCSEPSWKYYVQQENDWARTIEVDMTDRIGLDFVIGGNKQAYEETKQHHYRRSYTRLVILTEKSNGNKNGFLMTLLPSPGYINRYPANICRTLYLNRDTRYDGMVIYHRLDGSFANGWLYRDGKVAGALQLPESWAYAPDSIPKTNVFECYLMPCTYKTVKITKPAVPPVSGTAVVVDSAMMLIGMPPSW